MTERRNLGQVLHQYGRIGMEEQERALAYQREHGGRFGEALVALGLITPEEIEFGLAAQFDLPYVFPDPASIDLDAAHLVPPEWALAHLALPIAGDEDTLRVVVDSPIKPEAVAALEARTGRIIELAIASPARIRELIVHAFRTDSGPTGRTGEVGSGARPAADAGDLLDRALASGAARFGVSVRGRAVLGWWVSEAREERTALLSGWPGSVEGRVESLDAGAPSGAADGTTTRVRVRWGGTAVPATARRLSLPGGEEFVLDFDPPGPAIPEGPVPPGRIVDEVRLLVRAGVGRFIVEGRPGELARERLPHLPALLLGEGVRAMHLSADEVGEALAERLAPFQLDALTIEAPGTGGGAAIRALVEGVRAAFVVLSGSTDPSVPPDEALAGAGFSWRLTLAGKDRDPSSAAWDLRPLVPPSNSLS